MIPSAFDYKRAGSVDEALQLLSASDNVKLLAGGHSLLPAMKLNLNNPDQLVDISELDELIYVKEEEGMICIGACTTHQEIVSSSIITAKLPVMAEAGSMIGDMQVRNKGTIGGSLAHADPAADWPAVLLVCDAEILLKSAAENRTVSAAEFFTGLYATVLRQDELIVEIRIPIPASDARSAYVKFMQPASRFAIVGCAVMTSGNGTFEDVRMAFTGVAASAFRDHTVESNINGKPRSRESIAEAAEKAAEGVDVLGDHFASGNYRKNMAKVYAKRALEAVM